MKGVRKEHLPSKPCAVCGRPFVWRRKWARVWDEVKYCSDRCRARRGAAQGPANQPFGAGCGAMRAMRSGSNA